MPIEHFVSTSQPTIRDLGDAYCLGGRGCASRRSEHSNDITLGLQRETSPCVVVIVRRVRLQCASLAWSVTKSPALHLYGRLCDRLPDLCLSRLYYQNHGTPGNIIAVCDIPASLKPRRAIGIGCNERSVRASGFDCELASICPWQVVSRFLLCFVPSS